MELPKDPGGAWPPSPCQPRDSGSVLRLWEQPSETCHSSAKVWLAPGERQLLFTLGSSSREVSFMHHQAQFLKLSRASRTSHLLQTARGIRSGIRADIGLSQVPVGKEICYLPLFKMLMKKRVFDLPSDCCLLLSLNTKILSYLDEVPFNSDAC